MKRIVVFTGSGVSAESGLKTFRDSNGLWENYRVEDVATPLAWERNPGMVLEFYNQRRKQVMDANPNAAHLALAKLEENFNVHVVTQNIDDLHERSGSTKVLHLHGEINKSRSTADASLVYEINSWELKLGDCCEKGSQLRPHIVWFGELVPELDKAAGIISSADVLIVIGTSLLVYPAAGLIQYASFASQKYFIDPNATGELDGFRMIRKKAGEGTPALVDDLVKKYKT